MGKQRINLNIKEMTIYFEKKGILVSFNTGAEGIPMGETGLDFSEAGGSAGGGTNTGGDKMGVAGMGVDSPEGELAGKFFFSA